MEQHKASLLMVLLLLLFWLIMFMALTLLLMTLTLLLNLCTVRQGEDGAAQDGPVDDVVVFVFLFVGDNVDDDDVVVKALKPQARQRWSSTRRPC